MSSHVPPLKVEHLPRYVPPAAFHVGPTTGLHRNNCHPECSNLVILTSQRIATPAFKSARVLMVVSFKRHARSERGCWALDAIAEFGGTFILLFRRPAEPKARTLFPFTSRQGRHGCDVPCARSGGFQDRPGVVTITADLSDQVLEAGKRFIAADSGDKAHRQLSVV